MNKTIKLKQLVGIMPESARLMFCQVNSNGDTENLGIVHVGDYDKYSTYMNNHIKFIEIQGSLARIFI